MAECDKAVAALRRAKTVEKSHLAARRTLEQLGIPRAAFHRWYDRFLTLASTRLRIEVQDLVGFGTASPSSCGKIPRLAGAFSWCLAVDPAAL